MQALKQALFLNPVFYVTRDIERALGLDLNTNGYFIISNYSVFAKSIAKNHKNVFLIKEKKQLDTWELLEHSFTKQTIQRMSNILVFKNTTQIEKICQKNNWCLLNPPAKLAGEIEEKISAIKWLGMLKKYLPKYQVKKCGCIKWTGKQFVLQFNRSHTGSGTIKIKTKTQLTEFQNKFPLREARLAPYIDGPLFTNNNIVWKNTVLLGNINYQITGLEPFTDLPFAGIGNDWALPHKILTTKQIKQFQKIATDVGQRMRRAGWKGLFGIDVVTDKKTGRLYLLEINARQPASASFESQLQSNLKTKNITTFEAHLASLLKIQYDNYKLVKINDGAQIIQRVTNKISKIKNPKYKIQGLIIKYNNTKPGADLLRIQSDKGIMAKHNKLKN